jgi:type I restriction enzyme S subunit
VEGFTNAVQEIGYQGIRAGDLVIHSMDGFAGAIGVCDSDGKASPVVHCYEPAGQSDPRYYAYILRILAQRDFITSLAKGIRERSTAFDAETFRSLVLPHPPLAEQRAIADFLDAETTRLDALVAKKRLMLKSLAERVQAAVDSELGAVEAVPLKRFVTKIGSGSTPRGGVEVYVPEGAAFLRSQNVQTGHLDLTDVAYIDSAAEAELARVRVRPGDVLLNITGGSIGRATVFPGMDRCAYVSQHVAIVRPDGRTDPDLLAMELSSKNVQDQIALCQVGGNREGLNFDQVGSLLVRLPLDPQQVLQRLVRLQNRVARLSSDIGRQLDLLAEHRQALITAAVTGRFVAPNGIRQGQPAATAAESITLVMRD